MTADDIAVADARSPAPVDPSDAYWYGIEMNRMILGFDLPDPDEIRSALRHIATATVLGAWIDPDGPTWIPVGANDIDDWLDEVIVEFSEPVTEPSRMRELETGPLKSVPFRLMLGPAWLALHQDHVLGDGWSAYAFLSHLLDVARGAAAATKLPWTELLRTRRAARSVTQVGKNAATLARAIARRSELRGGPYQPAHQQTAYDPSVICRSSTVGFNNQLRQLRDERYPGASVVGMTLAAMRRTIAKHVAEPRPGTEVLFNTRSGVATNALGNYSAGLFINSDDDTDPAALSRAMATTRNSGLPDIAVAAARWRRPPRGDDRMVAAPVDSPRLTMSFTPRHGPISQVPGTNDSTLFCLATVPNGVETITITVLELANRMCVTLSFYEHAWPRESVRAALDEFLDSPVSVLGGGAV